MSLAAGTKPGACEITGLVGAGRFRASRSVGALEYNNYLI
jgi:hypothetical protein